MTPEEKNDWLESCLRDNASYIADDGFSARVMQTLPPLQPARARAMVRDWRRFAVFSGMTALAFVATVFQMPDPEIVLAQVTMAFNLQSLGSQLLPYLIFGGAALGATAILGSGLAAFLQADG